MNDAYKPFDDAERQRFRNLLRLAAESPFPNERDNARVAAERMAARHGMTLDEAASGGPPPSVVVTATPWPTRPRETASFVHLTETFIRSDKKRRDDALREARARGLDAEESRTAAAARPIRLRPRSGGRSPHAHARVLIRETRLPLGEVAVITGLNIYQVVGLKLKMRVAA